jgi:hypothetical protein
MKTTLDLPEALVKQVKLRALHEGQKLKDAVADLLRKGLASSGAPQAPVVTSPRVVKDDSRQRGLRAFTLKHGL